jgi:branched-subunit amino acid aminotransferase/4-amino-4-deoxychorismate lyase
MNGIFVDEQDAKISIYDSALMFGDMVFEMTRSFNGTQFKLKEHIERLFYGLKILRIDIPLTKEELEDVCYQTMEVNKPFFSEFDEHRLIIDISRGLLGIYQDVAGLHKDNVFFFLTGSSDGTTAASYGKFWLTGSGTDAAPNYYVATGSTAANTVSNIVAKINTLSSINSFYLNINPTGSFIFLLLFL